MNIDVQKLWKSYAADMLGSAGIMEKRVARKAFFAGAGIVVALHHVNEAATVQFMEEVGDVLGSDEAQRILNKRQGTLSLVGGSDHAKRDD